MGVKKFWIYTVLWGVLMGFSLAAQAEATDRVDTVSRLGFGNTVETLTKVIKSKGMMIVATVDHQNMLSMVGLKIKGVRLSNLVSLIWGRWSLE